MLIRKIFTAIALAAVSLGAWAVPAMPGLHRLTQPDGSVVEAYIHGDESFHYYETNAGELLMRDAAGTLRPVSVNDLGEIVVSGEITGRATTDSQRAAFRNAVARKHDAVAPERMKTAPSAITQKFPTTGTVTGLILLCEFQDVKLTPAATQEHYSHMCNDRNYQSDATFGSVLDYFEAQSGGKFTPQFDVVGPITLPYDMAHYGATNDVKNLFRDAAIAADEQGLDFSKYDVNDDGFVDFLFVVFAGYGEAQGGNWDTIWPAMQDVSNLVFDWFDGLNLSVAACASELKGNSGQNLDGVATICHEFSHILGLADIYDTSNQGGHGMSHFDIMDVGTYNDNLRTPSGYTAMDKFTLGWIEPKSLEEAGEYTLQPFSTSHESYFIVNPANSNEYYTLENRQLTSWDKGLPGHGLVISYCHYEPRLWRTNTVNSTAKSYEHVRIVAADNLWIANSNDPASTANNEAGDPFPGTSGNTSLSGTTTPAAVWNSTGKNVDWQVYDIRENEDGSVTFRFAPNASGLDAVNIAGESITSGRGYIDAPEGARIFTLDGRETSCRNLPAGIYIVVTSNGAKKITVK